MRLIPIFVLIGFCLACGGGSNAVSTTDSSSNVTISGTVDFSGVSAKTRFAPSNSQVSLTNISTGEETIVTLNSDGTYTANVAKGSYEITAKSSSGQILKLLAADVQEDMKNQNVDVDTTVIAAYIANQATSSLAEFSASDLKKKLLESKAILDTTDSSLTNATVDSTTRTIALNMLALKESVKAANQAGGDPTVLLTVTKIKERVAASTVLDNLRDEAAKNLITRSGRPVLIPTASGDLTLSTVAEVTQNISIINDPIVVGPTGTVTIPNRAPIASAGFNKTLIIGETAFLDGTLSRDPDKTPCKFDWAFISKPNGSLASIRNSTTATPSFRPDKIGKYHVSINVDDGKASSSDSLWIKVEPSNRFGEAVFGESVYQ